MNERSQKLSTWLMPWRWSRGRRLAVVLTWGAAYIASFFLAAQICHAMNIAPMDSTIFRITYAPLTIPIDLFLRPYGG